MYNIVLMAFLNTILNGKVGSQTSWFKRYPHFGFRFDFFHDFFKNSMGSSLGPIKAGIFMVDLETKLIPQMSEFLKFWKRYVDDTLCIVIVMSLMMMMSGCLPKRFNKDKWWSPSKVHPLLCWHLSCLQLVGHLS